MRSILSRCHLIPVAALALATLALAHAADDPPADPYDQSKVPLEVEPTDASLPKIVLVAGRASHGPGEHEFFAGTAILMKCLKQNGVAPVMARDGWPKNEAIFKGAKSVVLFMDGGAGHPLVKPERMELMQKLMDAKAGFVNLHYATEYQKRPGEKILNWNGGFYEQGYSINPHWDATFAKLPTHPITRGVQPFKLRDEWYYNIRFTPGMKGVTPILTATPPDNTRGTAAAKEHPGREEIVAWAFDRPDGGRGFGFTGAHFHKNWGDENYRRLIVNAILWSAQLEVPAAGAKVAIEPADLTTNLDRKGLNRQRAATPPAAKPDKDGWTSLFDGKSLDGWKSSDFYGAGKVHVQDGAIVMDKGNSMTGITFAGKEFPKTDYEVSFEGKKVEGRDFFCTATFPVGDDFCSFVVGGWGGTTVGLSSVDSEDASSNETSQSKEFKQDQWYKVRIRVGKNRIQTWIDDEQLVNLDTTDRRISIRIECRASTPFGICTYETTGAVRGLRVRPLTESEKKALAEKKPGEGK